MKKALEKLEKGVEEVFRSETFRNWLDVQTRFHAYSYSNTIMILMQRPRATQVAGFRTWKKMGRHVKKGEKGIMIFAPNQQKLEVKTDDGEIEEFYTLRGFRPVYVFDIEQTDGKELPKLVENLQGNSEVAEWLMDRLHGLAEAEGLSVGSCAGRANGSYNPVDKKIAIKEGARDQMAKTFIHEMAHHYSHEPEMDRAQSEVIAEGSAYIVSSHFGLDTGEYSFGYVAGWAVQYDLHALKQTARLIQQTANKIIKGLEAEQKLLRRA